MNSASLPAHVHFTNTSQFQNFYDLFKVSEQDKKFVRILFILFAVYFIIGVVVPFLTQVEVPRATKEQLPVHLTKLILKEKQLPPPEKVIPQEKKPAVVEEVEKPKTPAAKSQAAKEKAKSSGLAAMKDELFSMRDAFEIKPNEPVALNRQQSTETKVKRKLLAAQANKQSNELSAAHITQTVVSEELSTRNTRQVRLSEEEVLAGTDVMVDEELTDGSSGQRSEMSLRRSLEVHKARLYARYNRALRKDPFLQGKVMFEIDIQPNGKVSRVLIKSSELNHNKLERQLMAIIRSIRFPVEDVELMTTIWAIDFLPK